MSTPQVPQATRAPLQRQTTDNAPVPRRTLKDILNGAELRAAIKAAMPRHLSPDRFIRIAITALSRVPKLKECTPESLLKCLVDLSSYGLEPDGRRAHLIPYRNKRKLPDGREEWVMEVQLIIDYKGLVELVRRSGEVSYIHADCVYTNDKWSFSFGSDAHLRHQPNTEDRGPKVIAVYSFVKMKDGTEDFIVLSRSDVEKVRARSKSKDSGPWVTDWDEMAKKTVFRRHSKWLPFSAEIRERIEADDALTGEGPSVIDVQMDDTAALDGIEKGQITDGQEEIDTDQYTVEQDEPTNAETEDTASKPAQATLAGIGSNALSKAEFTRVQDGLKRLGKAKNTAQVEDFLSRWSGGLEDLWPWLEEELAKLPK